MFLNMSDQNQQANNLLAEEIAQVSENVSEADMNVLKEMAQYGVMFGHKKTRTNPRFKNFIFTTRNGIEIIDLAKTVKGIEEVSEFLKTCVQDGKIVLLIGTQPASWEVLGVMAQKFNFPMIKNKWIGGLLTNFKNLYQRLEYYRKLKADMESGALDKYTKKERAMFNKTIAKMQQMFEGLDNLTKLPDAVFIIDPSVKGHTTALREARIAKIPVAAVVDSDDNPDLVDYAIAANDHSKMSITWVVNKIIEKI